MMIKQYCYVCFDIYCPQENRDEFYSWVKQNLKLKVLEFGCDKFVFLDMWEDDETLKLYGEAKVTCKYIPPYYGTRFEPPEPAYIEGIVDEDYFQDWLLGLIPSEYDVEVDFDNDRTNIPWEEDLIREVEED